MKLRESARNLIVATFALIGIMASASAVGLPPPPDQVIVDCARPVYASDQLVCDDPEILELDRRVGSLLADLVIDSLTVTHPDFESQTEWMRRRSLCAFSAAHRECLRALYVERAALLAELLATQRRGFDGPPHTLDAAEP